MSQVIVNNFTTQKPLTVFGDTGVQSLAVLPAARVFIKTAESTTAAPVGNYTAFSFKTNGNTPTGWTDLGIMDAPAKITYTKNVDKIMTGMDQVVRLTYAKSKDATIDFSLWQTDDYVLSQLGFNGSVATSGSTKAFFIGQEDVISTALLCVYCNKIDGKELHFYHPAAQLSVEFDSSGDKLLTKVSAELIAFTPQGQTKDALFAATIFA
jgi:hypothetical protein